MEATRPYPTLDELADARRRDVLRVACEPLEIRILRAIMRGLGATVPAVADAAGLPAWKVSRTLSGKRPADEPTLAAVRSAIGVTRADIAAARRFAVAERLRHLRDVGEAVHASLGRAR